MAAKNKWFSGPDAVLAVIMMMLGFLALPRLIHYAIIISAKIHLPKTILQILTLEVYLPPVLAGMLVALPLVYSVRDRRRLWYALAAQAGVFILIHASKWNAIVEQLYFRKVLITYLPAWLLFFLAAPIVIAMVKPWDDEPL
jgi:hypothetical protein